jgi:hypothetical protein
VSLDRPRKRRSAASGHRGEEGGDGARYRGYEGASIRDAKSRLLRMPWGKLGCSSETGDTSVGRRETKVKQTDHAADPRAGVADTVASPPLTPPKAKTNR